MYQSSRTLARAVHLSPSSKDPLGHISREAWVPRARLTGRILDAGGDAKVLVEYGGGSDVSSFIRFVLENRFPDLIHDVGAPVEQIAAADETEMPAEGPGRRGPPHRWSGPRYPGRAACRRRSRGADFEFGPCRARAGFSATSLSRVPATTVPATVRASFSRALINRGLALG